jgi:hypothetical protein
MSVLERNDASPPVHEQDKGAKWRRIFHALQSIQTNNRPPGLAPILSLDQDVYCLHLEEGR